MEITINNRTYSPEGDHYNGDLVLISGERTVTIDGGYSELKQNAVAEVGSIERGYRGDELEYSDDDVRRYVEQHIDDYVRHCFAEGKIKVD